MAVAIGKGSFKGFGNEASGAGTGASSPVAMAPIGESQATEPLITRNLQNIQNYVTESRFLIEKMGTSNDSEHVRNELKNIQAVANKTIKETNVMLKTFSQETPDNPDEVHTWSVKVKRYKEKFQEILTSYQDLQTKARQKERASLRKSVDESGLSGVEISQEGKLIQNGQQVQIDAVKAEVDLDLIKDREADLLQLERDIRDINEIFHDLNKMVVEQGEQIDNAEKNVEEAQVNVETGVEELGKAEEYVTSSRRKMVFIILIAVAIIAVIVAIILGVTLS